MNFTGSLGPNWTDGTCISTPCWNFVQGGDSSQSIIFDLYPGTAAGLSFENIAVHPYQKESENATVICDPATLVDGEQDALGFNCTRGPYQVTPIKEASGSSGAGRVGASALVGVAAVVLGALFAL